MGLDVYLYYYTDFDKSQALEKEYEEKSEAIWARICNGKQYEELTDIQKNLGIKRTDALKKKLKLDEWGSDSSYKRKIEIDSKNHPDHMFKIGYLRSSYNGGGINNVLRNSVGLDLYYIFNVTHEEYNVRPDWNQAKERCREIRDKLQTFIDASGGVSVEGHSFNPFADIKEYEKIDTPQTALDVFLKVKNEDHHIGSFSNIKGHFFLDRPLPCRAIIMGVSSSFRGTPVPTAWVIFDNPDSFKWYIEALEVTEEMIDFVLEQEKPENYVLHWSG